MSHSALLPYFFPSSCVGVLPTTCLLRGLGGEVCKLLPGVFIASAFKYPMWSTCLQDLMELEVAAPSYDLPHTTQALGKVCSSASPCHLSRGHSFFHLRPCQIMLSSFINRSPTHCDTNSSPLALSVQSPSMPVHRVADEFSQTLYAVEREARISSLLPEHSPQWQ